MFAKLNTLVAEVLTERAHYGLVPQGLAIEALQLHVDVASAIQRGSGEDAQASMLQIMNSAFSELSSIWTHHSPE